MREQQIIAALAGYQEESQQRFIRLVYADLSTRWVREGEAAFWQVVRHLAERGDPLLLRWVQQQEQQQRRASS